MRGLEQFKRASYIYIYMKVAGKNIIQIGEYIMQNAKNCSLVNTILRHIDIFVLPFLIKKKTGTYVIFNKLLLKFKI